MPSRGEILDWEIEHDRLAADILAAEETVQRLKVSRQLLSEKIAESWRLRTPTMNNDVVDAIIDQFRPNPDFPSFDGKSYDYSTLCNLCRVSKQWLHPSRNRLYHTFERCVRVRSSSLLVQTIQASPNLGCPVRHLVLQETKLIEHLHLFPNIDAL
jgi:hypothetical protein